MRAAKRHERKAPTGDFRRKERSDSPEQEITGAAPFSGNARPGKCFSRRIGKTKRGPRRRGRHARRKNDHREQKKKEKYSPSLSPIPKKTISAARSPSHYPRRPIAPPENWRGRIEFRLKKCYLGPSSRRALKALAASRFPIFHIPTWDVKTPRPTLRTRPAPPPSLSGISPELAVEIERGGGRDGGRPGGA
jgi:hypothetical protein